MKTTTNPNTAPRDFVTVGELLATKDPDADGITVSRGTVALRWRYDYEIELQRIREPIHLVAWMLHLNEKNWITENRLRLFAEAVCKVKGWDAYRTP